MAGIRKRHSQHIKVKVVLEAMKGQLTTAELTSKYGVHASQIMTWKKRALAVLPEAFSDHTQYMVVRIIQNLWFFHHNS